MSYGDQLDPAHQSGIGSFLRCPYRFHLRRIGQSQEKILTQALMRGTIWHEYQRQVNLVILDNGGYASRDAVRETWLDVDTLLRTAEKADNGRLNVLTRTRRQQWIKDETVFIRRTAMAMQDILDRRGWTLLAAEQQFTMQVGPYWYQGRIDALYRDGDHLHLVDYKTGQEERIPPLYLMERLPQLVIYSEALMSGYLGNYQCEYAAAHLFSIRSLLINGRTGKPRGLFDHVLPAHRIDMVRGMAEVEYFVDCIRAAEEQGRWPRNPTAEMSTCRGCAYEQRCADAHNVTALKTPMDIDPNEYYKE